MSTLRHGLAEHLRAGIVTYFFVTLVLLLGTAGGALAARIITADQKAELLKLLQTFFHSLTGTGLSGADLLPGILLAYLKTIGAIWLLGFTIIGIPFILLIVFIRGFVIGFTVGFLVEEYVSKGLAFALASVFPHNLLAVPGITLAGVAAIRFSLLLLRRSNGSSANLLVEATGYTILCFFAAFLLLLAGLIEAFLSPVFMKLAARLLVIN